MTDFLGRRATVAGKVLQPGALFGGEDDRARIGSRVSDTFGIRGYNVGGDYHFKRLLWLDWPAGTVTAHQFGDAMR